MARGPHSIKIAHDLWDALHYLRQNGNAWNNYKSSNACIEDILAYALCFRKLHALRISSLPSLYDQDLCHEFIRNCVENNLDVRNRLPKPATAEDLLALAKEWKRNQGR